MGDVRGDIPVRRADHGTHAATPPLLNTPGLDVHHLLAAERMLGPEPDGAPDDVMGIVGGESLLVRGQLRIHELFHRYEIGPGVGQRAGGSGGIPVLVADVVLHDDELPPAALLTRQEQPAEGVHPHAHRQEQSDEGDGGPPHEGDDQQYDDEDAAPGQKGLQQTPHPPGPVGNKPMEPQHPAQNDGDPGDHPPPPPLPHTRHHRRLRRHRTAVCPFHHVFPSTRPAP
ncbi:hypothetical protein GCM10010328_53410 [Streptomyces rubiginosohelvolus]|uniref:Uncharacterized protein n=1 Tax=Streptomyces rubiginosohelvolus TaxID=67362 RepID=A0ABQ3CA31_9ACTN|nr:hypothetical protein GCM10010328_53410 [Streptomyces pluricolorescens]